MADTGHAGGFISFEKATDWRAFVESLAIDARIPATDLVPLVGASPQLRFLLLAQPTASTARLEATLDIAAEPLLGWSNETAAAEGASVGCRGDYADYDRLLKLTAGLPLYVQNALKIAAGSYEGDIDRLCTALEERTHVVETAQELILADVFETFNDNERRAVGALSLSDVPLSLAEATSILKRTFSIEPAAAAAAFRRLRTTGSIQILGVDRFKVHDAIRPLGRAFLDHEFGAYLTENCLSRPQRSQSRKRNFLSKMLFLSSNSAHEKLAMENTVRSLAQCGG